MPFVVLASIKFQRDSNKAYLDVRDRIGNTLSQLQEGIAGVRVIQAFGREDVEAERFERRNQRLFDAHMRSVKISAWYLPVIELAGLVTTAVVVGVGGCWVHTGDAHARHRHRSSSSRSRTCSSRSSSSASCSTSCSRPAPR